MPPPIEFKYVQHPAGVWEDRVNFIVHLEGPYEEGLVVREQVGTRKIAPNQVELCCLPFYLYGFSLGDLLEISESDLSFQRITKKSGRFLFRMFFSCAVARTVQIADHCKAEFNALFEWHSSKFGAVDIETADLSNKFWEYAKGLQDAGELEVETGY